MQYPKPVCPIQETGRSIRNDKRTTGTTPAEHCRDTKAPAAPREGIHCHGDPPHRDGGAPCGANLWTADLTSVPPSGGKASRRLVVARFEVSRFRTRRGLAGNPQIRPVCRREAKLAPGLHHGGVRCVHDRRHPRLIDRPVLHGLHSLCCVAPQVEVDHEACDAAANRTTCLGHGRTPDCGLRRPANGRIVSLGLSVSGNQPCHTSR